MGRGARPTQLDAELTRPHLCITKQKANPDAAPGNYEQ